MARTSWWLQNGATEKPRSLRRRSGTVPCEERHTYSQKVKRDDDMGKYTLICSSVSSSRTQDLYRQQHNDCIYTHHQHVRGCDDRDAYTLSHDGRCDNRDDECQDHSRAAADAERFGFESQPAQRSAVAAGEQFTVQR